jgi:hypothetical protein
VVFGPLGDGDHVISGHKVRVARSPEGVLYSRFNDRGEVVASARLSQSLTLSLVPIEPASGPASGIVECLYLKLSTPIIVDSRDRVAMSLVAPVDYGVVAVGGDKSYNLVDSFPEASIPYKLALYGPPTQGVLCRFYRVDLEKPQGPGLAGVRVRVVNETGEVARVSSIVVPLDRVKVFYKPGTWVAMFNNISMILESRSVASIYPDPEPASADFEESPDVVRDGTRPIGYVVGRGEFKMVWGY